MSDHEPIVLQLLLDVLCVGFADKVHTPCVSWVKATDEDLLNYQILLNQALHIIHLPVDAFLCNNMNCSSALHFQQISNFAVALTDACLSAAETAIPQTCHKNVIR